MKRVFITRRIPAAKELLEPDFEVVAREENAPCPSEELPGLVYDFDAVLCTVSERFDRAVLGEGGRLRVLSNYAVGADNIDGEHARSLGISVYTTPDVVTPSTADLSFALLLALIRKVGAARAFVRAGAWRCWDPELFLGEELEGKTFGIVGFGKIGQAVARRALGFGLRLLVSDPDPGPAPLPLEEQVRRVSLAELAASSDYISLHCPLTAETRGLVDAELIARMERRPILINMARGGVVDTAALEAALRSGQLRGAALDVTEPEPLPASSGLLELERCLIVPHIGTATHDCRRNMGTLAARNIRKHFGLDA